MMFESHYDISVRENSARLRAALDKPLPETREMCSTRDFNPWGDLIDGMVGPYNSQIEDLAIDVLKAVRDRTTFDLLNDPKRELAAEMFMHVLAVWLCDYGTSPRGIFPSSGIREMWDELITKWEAYAAIMWTESP